MFDNLKEKMRKIILKPEKIESILFESGTYLHVESSLTNTVVSKTLDNNEIILNEVLNIPINKDIVLKKFMTSTNIKTIVVYVDGMADRTQINTCILKPLMSPNLPQNIVDNAENSIEISSIKKEKKFEILIDSVLSGDTLVFIDGDENCYMCETKGFDRRSVDKPQIEGTIKGPQEAFNETMRTNVTLIRKIIRNPNLTTEIIKVGEINKSSCAIMYINKLTNPSLLTEVRRRLSNIKGDLIYGSGMLEQFIEDNPYSIFPNVISTERPDRTASHLCEGRVAIIVDGTPFAIIAPISFSDLFHTYEDTSMRWMYGMSMRITRIIAFLISCLLAGVYVAVCNFHHEMIPTGILLSIARAIENVPFPTVFEILIMEIAFGLIGEAGVRVPGILGNTIGIIGALILGQAAVEAELISPVVIIIIAFIGISSYVMHNIAAGTRIIRLFLIFLGSVLGLLGISVGIVIIIALMCNYKSFGVPMMVPISPYTGDNPDFFINRPLWKKDRRPNYLNTSKPKKQPKISRSWDSNMKR